MGGPLIPGLTEFDGPRRRIPRMVWWLAIIVIAIGATVVLVGLFAGTGPARALGEVTTDLPAVAYRPTADARVIQVAVAVPAGGLCRGDRVEVRAFPRMNRIEVAAERTSARNRACAPTGIAQGLTWLDVSLDAPLGERSVIDANGRLPLSRETATSLG